MKQKCIKELGKLISKKNIFFTNRGNKSINLALKLAKSLGKKKAFIQNQGGWITYDQYLKKLNFEYHYLDTDYGIIDIKLLKEKLDSDSVLLINSMPGYFCIQEDMDKIEKLCVEKNCFLINDVSGSIGREVAKSGDLIIGSFGRWKPINLEYGGFIGFNNNDYEQFYKDNFDQELKDFYSDLIVKLKDLDKRLDMFKKFTHKIKKQLSSLDVIHKNSDGINVIVKTHNNELKLEVTDFCKLYDYEFTSCPRYIRVMDEAISIEVKRL